MLVATAVLAGSLALAAAPAVGAKKKRGGGSLNVTKAVNLPIPDRAGPQPGAVDGILTSTIDAGKQFKGRQIRDVNVTVQTLGTSPTMDGSDVAAKLSAPNGATLLLFSGLFKGFPPEPNPSIGPLTLDDEAPLDLGSSVPNDPTELYAPWAGSAAPEGILAQLDGGPVRGTWTLTMVDTSAGMPGDGTSNLVSWGLEVTAGRPFKTK